MSRSVEETTPGLNRTMGPVAATAIGVGTMVGAGIFVFPGIAGSYAGPAALVSFALGGGIALLVAFCTAELATALPESGGSYYFVSRSFGAGVGTLIGVAQWVGLIFASSFYLAGFSEYALRLLDSLAGAGGQLGLVLSIGAALVLLLLNLVGTKKVGYLQNLIVVALTAILLLLFSYGLVKISGLLGAPQFFEDFTPRGTRPIFSTTALIFTSYLGFVQIATVAGEIRAPQKNLPRALIGSVLIVLFLYLFILLVTTSILSLEQLQRYQETATLEVARQLTGDTGALIILAAGLLATLSSANASILSASRAIFALSKDRLVPRQTARVNDRFGTPHYALLLVAVPVMALLFRSNLEFFAQVASFLHLVIYAAICASLLQLRRRRPVWYVPTFRVRRAQPVAWIGGLACLGLIAGMEGGAILVGSIILVASAAYYWRWHRGISLPAPRPTHIDTAIRAPRMLIPIPVGRDPAPLSSPILATLEASKIFVLGYWKIPEQTEPEQAEAQYATEARERLEAVLQQTTAHQIDTEQELLFTKDPQGSIQQAIEEKNCQALLTVHETDRIERLLVPVNAARPVSRRLRTLLHELRANTPSRLTVLLTSDTPEEESYPAAEQRISRQLAITGLRVDTFLHSDLSETALPEIIEQHANASDLIVLAEAAVPDATSFTTQLFSKIEAAAPGPVLVVFPEHPQE